MSRGPGRIQKTIRAALEAKPGQWFLIEELASIVYGVQTMEAKHRVGVQDALALMTDLERGSFTFPDRRGRYLKVRVKPYLKSTSLSNLNISYRSAK